MKSLKLAVVATVFTTLATGAHAAQSTDGDAAAGIVLILFCLACYFLPTVVALARGKANGTIGVCVVNFFLGWTIIGWFTAFIWACSGETNREIAKRDRQHHELLSVIAAKRQS